MWKDKCTEVEVTYDETDASINIKVPAVEARNLKRRFDTAVVVSFDNSAHHDHYLRLSKIIWRKLKDLAYPGKQE